MKRSRTPEICKDHPLKKRKLEIPPHIMAKLKKTKEPESPYRLVCPPVKLGPPMIPKMDSTLPEAESVMYIWYLFSLGFEIALWLSGDPETKRETLYKKFEDHFEKYGVENSLFDVTETLFKKFIVNTMFKDGEQILDVALRTAQLVDHIIGLTNGLITRSRIVHIEDINHYILVFGSAGGWFIHDCDKALICDSFL